MNDDEKIESKKQAAISALADNKVYGDTAQLIMLMDSVDKLRSSVKDGTKMSSELTSVTNKLTSKIRTLTKALLIIGILALIFTGLSLGIQIFTFM